MAAGDIVNTAFRLAEAAPVNGILVDESTYRATYRFIEFGASDPVQAKGKAAPQFVWQAIAPRVRLGQADLHVAHAPHRTPRGASSAARRLRPNPGRAQTPARHHHRRPRHRQEPHDPELVAELDARPGTTYGARAGRCPTERRRRSGRWRRFLRPAGILRADDPSVTEEAWQAVRDAVPEAAEAEWIVGTMRALVGLSGDAHTPGDRRSGNSPLGAASSRGWRSAGPW